MKDGRLPKRQYTEEFKAEAARLAGSVGSHEAARRLGILVSTVGNWARRQRASVESDGRLPAAVTEVATRRPVSELEAENSRLRRELAEAKQDVEILKKATAYFARGSR
ncbi:hypothetical protein GCM10027287_17420 [Bordetella muralis]